MGITNIALYTFRNDKSLSKVILPKSLTSIDRAFYQCSIASIEIPENVEYIDRRAFESCPNLTHVKFFGIKDPKFEPDVFDECNVNFIEVTENYMNFTFCGYPVYVARYTPHFTESFHFSLSNQFSESSDFSSSYQFTKSADFSISNQFSESDGFLKTSHFSESSKFTKSQLFTQTFQFSVSFYFTKSNHFSESSKFTKSNQFDQTPTFSKSFYFTNSKKFTKSNEFSESSKITKSNQFDQTPTFSKSFYFTKSNKFSESSKFTKSKDFVSTPTFSKSFYFTKSKEFTSSFDFTKSNEFSESSKFTKSSQFKPTSLFTKSNFFSHSSRFSSSIHFTISNKFTLSNVFTASQIKYETFTMSNFFTISNIFSESDLFPPIPTPSNKDHIKSISMSILQTYVRVKTVIFSYSYLHSYVFYECINRQSEVSLCVSEIQISKYLQYIIYSYKPTEVALYISQEINQRKAKITQEKLIGISCGSASAFFSIVGITYLIIKKKNKVKVYDVYEGSEDFSESDDDNNTIKTNVQTLEITNNTNNIDGDFDNWL